MGLTPAAPSQEQHEPDAALSRTFDSAALHSSAHTWRACLGDSVRELCAQHRHRAELGGAHARAQQRTRTTRIG